MDQQTAFVIGALMMLANGGVLGLVHREILPQLQAGAVTWRRGTLLNACACLVFAAGNWLPPKLLVVLTDTLLLTGATCYGCAIRQFYQQSGRCRLLLPCLLGIVGVACFTVVLPTFKLRVVCMNAPLTFILLTSAYPLAFPLRSAKAISRLVLAGLFYATSAFVLVRMVMICLAEIPPDATPFDPPILLNTLTPMLIGLLPVIGTTAFLLMCAERLKRQWEEAASIDYLTGLPNRRTLSERGRRGFSDARALQRGYAVAVIDIDHFKSINDRYGHEVGDQALRHVARQLANICRSGETPTRQGGEEFVVLLDAVDEDQAYATGERLRRSVENAIYDEQAIRLVITVSIGVAVLTPEDASFDHLLTRADAALYAAKAGGRNRVMLAKRPSAQTFTTQFDGFAEPSAVNPLG